MSCAKLGVVALVPLVGCRVEPPPVDNGGSIAFEMTFSEPMDAASVISAMTISPDAADFINGEAVWSDNYTKLTYTGAVPDTTLGYTVTIGAGAKDLAGNSLDGNNDGVGGDPYSFTVAGGVSSYYSRRALFA